VRLWGSCCRRSPGEGHLGQELKVEGEKKVEGCHRQKEQQLEKLRDNADADSWTSSHLLNSPPNQSQGTQATGKATNPIPSRGPQ
jgi:hypothetical protein